MGQNTYSIRMDGDLKKQFDSVCNEIGLTSSAAITLFAKTVVREQRIPLTLELHKRGTLSDGLKAVEALRSEAVKNGTADMSMEEIDKEITVSRKERI